MLNKVLLVDSSIRNRVYNEFDKKYDIPYSLLALGSYLDAKGISVEIISMGYESTSQRKSEGEILRNYMVENNIKVVGFTSYTEQYKNIKKLARLVKNSDPRIITAIGGQHAMHQPEEALRTKLFDAVVIGEGEITFKDYLDKLFSNESTKNVRGIAYLDEEGNAVINPKRKRLRGSEIVTPNYALLPKDLVKNANIEMVTSRGCPNSCNFCSMTTHYGRKVATRPLDSVKEEIEILNQEYGHTEIGITDQTFHARPEFNEFIQVLKDLHDRLGVIYTAQTRADYVLKNPKALRMMKESGIVSLVIGAESASNKVLEAMNKESCCDKIPAALELIKEAGIETGTFWLVGHPGSSYQEEMKTKRSIEDLLERGLSSYVEVKIFVPFPGTKSSKDPRINWVTPDFSKLEFMTAEPTFSLEGFSKEEIKKAYLEIIKVIKKYGKKNADQNCD